MNESVLTWLNDMRVQLLYRELLVLVNNLARHKQMKSLYEICMLNADKSKPGFNVSPFSH